MTTLPAFTYFVAEYKNIGYMATIKVKFRPSTVADKEGTIYYQVIHRRVIRQIKTDYHVRPDEWDEKASGIRTGDCSHAERRIRLTALQGHIDRDMRRIGEIVERLEKRPDCYSADDIVDAFSLPERRLSLFGFMREVIARLVQMGKYRTAEIYDTVLRSFSAFRSGEDIAPDEVDADVIQLYEAYLLGSGLVRNTTSFYMRTLRAVYNRAVERGLTVQRDPFRHTYTGIDKTVKRAIPLKSIRKIRDLDLSLRPSLDFARDMFLFSFYTRGMSFVDMAYLRRKDLQNGVLTYCRHKTGQRLHIRWERCMQEIFDKYPSDNAIYMLSIIKKVGCTDDERRQYRNALRLVNDKLKTISKMAGLDVNLTMYVSRHSWASAARERNIPLRVISEGMGHDSETTTQIYLASLDSSAVDKANETILKSL